MEAARSDVRRVARGGSGVGEENQPPGAKTPAGVAVPRCPQGEESGGMRGRGSWSSRAVRRVGGCSALGVSRPSWQCWEGPGSWGVKNQGEKWGGGGRGEAGSSPRENQTLGFRNPRGVF